MSHPNLIRLSFLALIVPLGGFTECPYFDEVTVPTTDTVDPIPANRMMGEDGFDAIRLGTVRESVSSLDETFTPIAAVFDPGGARKLTMTEFAQTQCLNLELGIGSESFFPLSPDLTASQTGGVGHTVSNGIYIFGRVSRLRDIYVPCQPGFQLVKVTYSWDYDAEDFAGNRITGLGGVIIYTP